MLDMLSDEDELFPVYCLRCKRRTPRAVSDANVGYCAECLVVVTDEMVRVEADLKIVADNRIAAKQDAKQRRIEAAQERFGSKRNVVSSSTMPMGKCPQCGGADLIQFEDWKATDLKKKSDYLAGALLFPIAIVGVFAAGNGKRLGTSRECNSCGHRWPV